MANLAVLSITFSVLMFCDGFVLGTTNPMATATPSSYQFLEDLFLQERQMLSQYVVNMEHQLNTKTIALEHKLNQTLDQLANMTRTLGVEKDKRVQLQKDYDKLIMGFYNLTVKNVALTVKNQALVSNITNQDSELKQLKETVQNLTRTVNNINITAINSSHEQIQALRNNTDKQIGFTADYPKEGPSSGTIRFSNVLTNVGNGYNSGTGKFTCYIPGLYHFALVIYKTAYADVASCFIRHNVANKVEAFSSPPVPGGYFESSTSVVLHLKRGDTVDLAGCSSATHMEWLTTFSGFLISAD